VALPDGKTVLFSTGATDDVRRIGVMSLPSRSSTVLDVIGIAPLGLRDGHLLYVTRAGALMALPFDAKRTRATGDPFQIQDSIRLSGGVRAATASLSASGTLGYLSGSSDSHLVLSAPGRPDVPVVAEPHGFNTPRFSPDGRKIAVTVLRPGTSDIWVYDLAAHTFAMVTTEGRNGGPEWAPDGKRILFRSNTPEGKRVILWQPADRSAKSEVLYQPDELVNEALMSPDAKWLLFRTAPGERDPTDILAVPLTGDKRSVMPLVTGPAVENLPRFSPDGRWIAYQSNESGRFEIYVRPFPGAGSRVQVSNEGGTEPVWARSGRALFYRTAAGIVSVAVTTGTTFSLGERRVALPGDYLGDPTHANYDVSPDGSQFLMLKAAGVQATPIIVHNWGREFREKLGSAKRP
jgi:serine/threonine-protein kinase